MDSLKQWSLIFIAFVAALTACDSDDRQASGSPTAILNGKPFRSLSDSIRADPENPELRLRRAMRLSQNNHHAVADDDYRIAWEFTGDPQVALMYISNLLLTGNVQKAVDLLSEGAEKFPENTEFNRRLGEVYLQQGLPEQALVQFETILDRDDENFEAWFDRGKLLAQMKDTNGAIESLESSFSLMPINYTGLALANLYVSRKDPRALEVCNVLLARDSADAQTEPLFMKGMYYSEVKAYDKALAQFDECIRRDWKMTDAYIEKGIIMYERKKFNEALEVFNMAATVSNTDADAYFWMGRCFESTGDRDRAIINYERAFALDNSFVEASAALKRLSG